MLTESTQRPTVGFGLAEGKGDLLSTSSGQWALGEFGYNPISNNLGASLAAGTSDALNIANGDSLDGQCKWALLLGLVGGP